MWYLESFWCWFLECFLDDLCDSDLIAHSRVELATRRISNGQKRSLLLKGRSVTNATKPKATKEAQTEFSSSDVGVCWDLRRMRKGRRKKMMSPDSRERARATTSDVDNYGARWYLTFRWSLLRRQSLFSIPEWTGVDRLISRAAGR